MITHKIYKSIVEEKIYFDFILCDVKIYLSKKIHVRLYF
jgi:hypothetical protein